MLTIITAVAGRYDTPKAHVAQSVPVRWVRLNVDEPVRWGGLNVDEPDIAPVMVAKHPKVFPWEYSTTERSVWIDGSMQITSPDFAAAMLAALDHGDVAQFRHHSRDCVYDEAAVCAGLQRFAGMPFADQVATYRADGHPTGWGLWETGMIARRHTAEVRAASADWWEELVRWTPRDQISWPVVLRRHGLRPVELPGWHLDNPWLTYHPHRGG